MRLPSPPRSAHDRHRFKPISRPEGRICASFEGKMAGAKPFTPQAFAAPNATHEVLDLIAAKPFLKLLMLKGEGGVSRVGAGKDVVTCQRVQDVKWLWLPGDLAIVAKRFHHLCHDPPGVSLFDGRRSCHHPVCQSPEHRRVTT